MGGQALGALGLRGRIVGAVLVTAVAALAVAAVVLLGPLGHSLRNAENTLASTCDCSRVPGFGSFVRPYCERAIQISR